MNRRNLTEARIERLLDERVEKIKEELEKEKREIRKEAQKEVNQLKKEVEKLKADGGQSKALDSSKDSKNISRREFLKKAGLGTAGLAALGISPVSGLNLKSDSLRFSDNNNSYWDIDPASNEMNVNNVNLNMNNQNISAVDKFTGVNELELPVSEASSDNRIWLDSSKEELKIKIGGKTYFSKIEPSWLIDTFEDGDTMEWSEGYDTGVGGIQTTTNSFNGSYAGKIFTNSSGSLVTLYNTKETLDASTGSITISAYVRWNSTGTTLTFGVVDSTDTDKSISFGAGYKSGNDWVLHETKSSTRNRIATSNTNGLNTGTWYEAEFKIESDNSITATIYDLANGERDSERVQMTGTATYSLDLSALYVGGTAIANNSGTYYDMYIDDVQK